MALNTDINLDAFIEDFRAEIIREIGRKPQTTSALTELTVEVGMLAQSMMDIIGHRSKDWWQVWQGAKHVAAMAAACALAGDLSLGAVPTEANTA